MEEESPGEGDAWRRKVGVGYGGRMEEGLSQGSCSSSSCCFPEVSEGALSRPPGGGPGEVPGRPGLRLEVRLGQAGASVPLARGRASVPADEPGRG